MPAPFSASLPVIRAGMERFTPSISEAVEASFKKKSTEEMHRRPSAVDRVEARQLEMLDLIEDLAASFKHVGQSFHHGAGSVIGQAERLEVGAATEGCGGQGQGQTAVSPVEKHSINMMITLKDIERKIERLSSSNSVGSSGVDGGGGGGGGGGASIGDGGGGGAALAQRPLQKHRPSTSSSAHSALELGAEAEAARVLEAKEGDETLQADGDKLRAVSSQPPRSSSKVSFSTVGSSCNSSGSSSAVTGLQSAASPATGGSQPARSLGIRPNAGGGVLTRAASGADTPSGTLALGTVTQGPVVASAWGAGIGAASALTAGERCSLTLAQSLGRKQDMDGKRTKLVAEVAAMKEQITIANTKAQGGKSPYLVDPRHSKHLAVWDCCTATALVFTAIVSKPVTRDAHAASGPILPCAR